MPEKLIVFALIVVLVVLIIYKALALSFLNSTQTSIFPTYKYYELQNTCKLVYAIDK